MKHVSWPCNNYFLWLVLLLSLFFFLNVETWNRSFYWRFVSSRGMFVLRRMQHAGGSCAEWIDSEMADWCLSSHRPFSLPALPLGSVEKALGRDCLAGVVSQGPDGVHALCFSGEATLLYERTLIIVGIVIALLVFVVICIASYFLAK